MNVQNHGLPSSQYDNAVLQGATLLQSRDYVGLPLQKTLDFFYRDRQLIRCS